ncbi:glycoside hydrolase family 16 protein [Planctomycetales bacterium ZRK34]|nr:glycoside hydrolase family 16 protein [Planctomycetales bacterium ZRK34]
MRNLPQRLTVLAALFLSASLSDAAEPRPLIDVNQSEAAQRFSPGKQVAVKPADGGAGVVLHFDGGPEGWPGVSLKPDGGAWDFSKYGHIEATLTNVGNEPINLSLRVDNAGDWRDNPWNTESATLKPGETGTIKVVFGFGYNHRPNYPLNTAEITGVLFFTGKSDKARAVRIDSLIVGGEAGEIPPIAPEHRRIIPADGYMLGGSATFDVRKQVEAYVDATAAMEGSKLRITLPAERDKASVKIKPVEGKWALTQWLEVHVTLRNAGDAAIKPRVELETQGGKGEPIGDAAAIEPGASSTIVIPFQRPDIWNGERKSGNVVTSDKVLGVRLAADTANGDKADRVLVVDAIRAVMPPTPTMPDWLGKRPPVEGDWSLTFEENFDAPAIDESRWNIYTENYWDKLSHFSKDNVILGDGLVRLHMQQKIGYHNDNPKRYKTPYAVGFLDTYGKWTQRYGYFESRMKLPTAPGLWPAFWMMPDRGEQAGDQGARANTAKGGMEFDIMEHLTGWGPLRYNIAMHWDGYGKGHKSTGSDRIYVQPDADGFITAGLLWLPGQATFYANGKVVAEWKNDRVSNVQSYLMFDLVTGGWDNTWLDPSKLPDDFVIDYVRCWQRADLK